MLLSTVYHDINTTSPHSVLKKWRLKVLSSYFRDLKLMHKVNGIIGTQPQIFLSSKLGNELGHR